MTPFSEIAGDGVERAALYVGGEIFKRADDEIGATAEGESEAVTGEGGIGFKDAVGCRVVWILIDGV
jgi:hypothetical protein